MSGISRPKPCYLDDFEVWKTVHGRKIWRSPSKDRLYTWDSLHGEIEVFNARGVHLGALHAETGTLIKPADKEKRKLNVK